MSRAASPFCEYKRMLANADLRAVENRHNKERLIAAKTGAVSSYLDRHRGMEGDVLSTIGE